MTNEQEKEQVPSTLEVIASSVIGAGIGFGAAYIPLYVHEHNPYLIGAVCLASGVAGVVGGALGGVVLGVGGTVGGALGGALGGAVGVISAVGHGAVGDAVGAGGALGGALGGVGGVVGGALADYHLSQTNPIKRKSLLKVSLTSLALTAVAVFGTNHFAKREYFPQEIKPGKQINARENLDVIARENRSYINAGSHEAPLYIPLKTFMRTEAQNASQSVRESYSPK